MAKFKVRTVTTHFNDSTYMVEAVSQNDAVAKVINGKAELIQEKPFSNVEFPKVMSDFIISEF